MTTLNGIDVSNVNGKIGWSDWAQWRGKIQFVGVKITEGCWFADQLAPANVRAVHALGVPVIGYHFLHANTPGSKQAEYFLKYAHLAGLEPGRDLIAIDAEDGGRDGLDVSHLTAAAEEFAAELRPHFGAYHPVLYTEISLAPSFTGMGDCPLWLANPSGSPVTSIGPWKTPSFEQTGQRSIDTDVFYGDEAQLRALAIPAK